MRNSNLEVYGTTDERTNEGGGGLDTQPILVYFLLRLPEDRSIPSVTTTQHPEIASVDTDTILKTNKKRLVYSSVQYLILPSKILM